MTSLVNISSGTTTLKQSSQKTRVDPNRWDSSAKPLDCVQQDAGAIQQRHGARGARAVLGGQEPVPVHQRTRPNPKPQPSRLRARGLSCQSHRHRQGRRPAHLHHQPEQRSHGIAKVAGGRHSGAGDSVSDPGRQRSDIP